ncbi:hypothetical protein I317_07908 [Kwoniella heveanensis CBS 569]|nr:hypothetical protein I317_07908 [Kwoniella heveanensis CBS 569]
MAAAVHMQPSTHRPSMDRAPSFDRPRSRSTPPFTSPYDPPSPPVVPVHIRTNSNSTSPNPSPYNQPFPNSYFPPQHQMYGGQPQSWATTAMPATAFYNPPFHGFPNGHPGQHQHQHQHQHQQQPQGYHQFQQSQADFAAWANAYQHMVMASVQNGGGHPGGISPPIQGNNDYQNHDRRRTSSGPGQQYPNGYFEQTPNQAPLPKSQQPPPQPYHPYKRGPSARPSREQLPRSTSTSSISQEQPQASALSRSSSSGQIAPDPRGTQSSPVASSSKPLPAPTTVSSRTREAEREQLVEEPLLPPPTLGAHSRSNSSGSERSHVREPVAQSVVSTRTPQPVATAVPSGPTSASASTSTYISAARGQPASAPRTSTPLHPGPITNATNTPTISRPSPLSQPSITPEPTDKMVKTGGLKGRLRKALDKDAKKDQRPPAPMGKQSLPPKHFASPSEYSTRSATPPATPPQHDLPPPSAPFTMNPAAMGSEISLAETERTATVGGENKEKGKRSLFRMKNMSTDNISLSSTVSSASMMIRKMGSIGKLARRNSLMGISRIFKDKPKDEDAALPEKEGKKKKDKKKKGKGDAAPATISHALAESDRFNEDDDRALAGLSPAAKLARQHTLRSKAEMVKKQTERSGEPTWDNNTATRQTQQSSLPSIASVTSSIPNGSTGPEVVRVHPSQAPTVVHAVAVTDQEYDSEDDSSEGETVEDVTMTLGRTRLSEEADAEFQATWGNAWIDRNAVPKKGILKSISSYNAEDPQSAYNRQRSNSTQASGSSAPGPLAQLPTSNPSQLDGLAHPSPRVDPAYDPFSSAFSPFDTPSSSSNANNSGAIETLYANPSHNTSAPTLSFLGQSSTKPPPTRSMTAPAVRRRINWAPECAVYSTYDPGTYDRRSEPATCNRLTPELAMAIKQELNAFKLEMPVHPSSKMYTHYFAW